MEKNQSVLKKEIEYWNESEEKFVNDSSSLED